MAAIDLIGGGAIGCLWSGYLARQGHQLRLFGRRHVSNNQLSLKLTLRDNSDYHITLPYADQTDETAGHQAELLIVTTKAYQVADALAPFVADSRPLPPIVLMHNGMGTLSELTLPATQPVLLATTSHGALMTANTAPDTRQVRHTGLGDTYLGLAHGQLSPARQQQIHHWLQQALPAVHWCDNIQRELWFKLAVNCAINPLTAIHGCRNGALAAPQFDETLQGICEEVAAVMNRLQLDTTATELRQRVDKVIELTADNYSSMHQDIHFQRRSEIDYISGHVVREAERLSVAAPVNRGLWRQISAKDNAGH